ncbi:hypothetical protein V6N11_008065 [Hibiscus sabdariffa]|uniref:SLH domain-containing protein n=1 Tax=Hibiscus sabdariffa TaxID=183260 RepID=A0ABR2PZJ0_9ROSI
MCLTTAFPSSLFIASEAPSVLLRRGSGLSFLSSPTSFVCYPRSSNSRTLRVSASLLHPDVDISWFPPDPNSLLDNYGDWSTTHRTKKKGFSSIFVASVIGSSLATAIAIAYFLFCRKGFKFEFRSPLNTFHGVFSSREAKNDQTGARDYLESDEQTAEATANNVPLAVAEIVPSAPSHKPERIVVPVAVDSTQLEALLVLKELAIIEVAVKPDELCTRREYARWLVRTSSLLERNPRHRIVPSIALSGSETAAFDDVGADDPDFVFIQALAEAGIIPSKLSDRCTASESDGSKGVVNFFPDRFISREDLINWKALVEYDFEPGVIEQISRTNVDFMDLKDISPDSSPGLFIDMLAAEKSILRKVFGAILILVCYSHYYAISPSTFLLPTALFPFLSRQSKRFQSNKPSSKPQAAVALTSGRMANAIPNELLKLEMESSSKRAEMKEIKSVLLEKGEIQRRWNEKLDEERARVSMVEELYFSAVQDLEQEKIVREKCAAECLKEKAAMDCQRQLVSSLKEEVAEMSERLASERTMYVSERNKLLDMPSDLQSKLDGILDTKSILEAEIEAIKNLKSRVEDEARKSQTRAKVLEEVERRWKWDDQA